MNKEMWLKLLKFIIKLLELILDESDEMGEGTGDTMQKCIFPMEYLRITADENYETHKGGCAIDLGGKDTKKDMIFAPCDLEVIRVRPNANGEVYYQSIEPVKFADGTTDYFRMLLLHDSTAETRINTGDIFVQGDWIYTEGGMGGGDPECFANHVHMEVGKGKWDKPMHLQMVNGNFAIENPSRIEDIFFIKKDTVLLNTAGKIFKEI